MKQGSPASIGQYLHIAPGHPPISQSLHHRLLACKAGGQLRQPPTTVFDLPLGINTLEETITPRIYRCSNAGYFHYIYAVCVHNLSQVISIHRRRGPLAENAVNGFGDPGANLREHCPFVRGEMP